MRLRAAVALQGADKAVQLLSGFERNLNKHGKIARDTVAFQNVRARFYKRIKRRFLGWLQVKADKRRYVVTELLVVQFCGVAGYNFVFFQPFDSGGRCR